MAQKINPINARLGKQVFWKSMFQIYGKSLVKYSFYHFVILHMFFLANITKKNFFLVSNFVFQPLTSLIIFSFPSPKYLVRNQVIKFQKALQTYKNWWSLNSSFIIFFNLSSAKSAQFIALYFKFLLTENLLFQKAMSTIILVLKQQLGQSKLIVSKTGLKKLILKGFKVSVVGRFENSKTQMAKKVDYKFGSLSLLSLNSFVEFSNIAIKSPLGTYNFKIWLFYH